MADGHGATRQMCKPAKAAISEQKRNAKYVIVAAQAQNGHLARELGQMRNCTGARVSGEWQMSDGK